MRVLSIQSHVSYGHVGNSAAVFPLQRLGHEVMPIYTVVFSNHTGYGAWGGQLISGEVVRGIVQGIDDRGGLADVDLVLSGYQGGNDIGDAILDGDGDAVADAGGGHGLSPRIVSGCSESPG